jgi:hypothetical protein
MQGNLIGGQMEMSLCKKMVRVHADVSSKSPKENPIYETVQEFNILRSLQIVVHSLCGDLATQSISKRYDVLFCGSDYALTKKLPRGVGLKLLWNCLSGRLVFAARSTSSAILSAFLLFGSFVEIRRCLPF